jgi:signal transduction histidine kinase
VYKTVDLVVSNEGEGVPPEDLPRVFDRFFRGGNARARAVGGSGLGLPIARWIVEKHGGEADPVERRRARDDGYLEAPRVRPSP